LRARERIGRLTARVVHAPFEVHAHFRGRRALDTAYRRRDVVQIALAEDLSHPSRMSHHQSPLAPPPPKLPPPPENPPNPPPPRSSSSRRPRPPIPGNMMIGGMPHPPRPAVYPPRLKPRVVAASRMSITA